MTKYRILHITPHLGGGVGRVLLNYLTRVKSNSTFLHDVVCLDYANDNAKKNMNENNLELSDNAFSNYKIVLKKIASADIVLIHWWNHPLLYDFMIRASLPPCRVIIWSHISGFHPPYVFTPKILNYPDLFVFTTPISNETKEVRELSGEASARLRVVWSTSGIDKYSDMQPVEHKGFNVGYIGTVDYSKMHPHFIRMSADINIKDIHFIVCGGAMQEQIRREAESLGVGDKFSFEGQVTDIQKYLSLFDVFGYPLAPYHYGTCEQALAEAMAAGVVPVVMANKTESYMVSHGITGFIAKDEKEYSDGIKELYNKPSLRLAMSAKTKEVARAKFSIDIMINAWEQLFDEVLRQEKTPRSWQGDFAFGTDITGAHVFLESLGEYASIFKDSFNLKNGKYIAGFEQKIQNLIQPSLAWKSLTKGTAHQYKTFFPDDKILEIWSGLTK